MIHNSYKLYLILPLEKFLKNVRMHTLKFLSLYWKIITNTEKFFDTELWLKENKYKGISKMSWEIKLKYFGTIRFQNPCI